MSLAYLIVPPISTGTNLFSSLQAVGTAQKIAAEIG
jgi:hypothetical protein